MLITPYSFFFSITWGSIISVVLLLFYKKLLKLNAYKTILISTLFIVLRLLFIVDLPINIKNDLAIIPVFITRLMKQVLWAFPVSYDTKYNVYGIVKSYRINHLFIIWLLGFIILVSNDIRKWRNVRKLLLLSKANYSPNHKTCDDIIKVIEKEYNRKIDLTIYCNDYTDVPFVIGLRKPSIYINPENFSKTQLYFILKHEIAHVINKDNWIKMAIHIFVLFYWWLPFLRVIPNIVDEACEYRCDKIVTQNMDSLNKIEYSSLINVVSAEELSFKRKKYQSYSAFAFEKHNDRIYERIHAIVKPQKISMLFAIPFYSIYICVIICSLLFSFPTIIQSNYGPPLPETISVSLNNSYLILNTDGTYALYTYDMLIDSNVKNVDELNLPIKNEGEKFYEQQAIQVSSPMP